MADLDPCLSVGTLCLQAVLYLRNIFKFTKINIYILKTSFDIEYLEFSRNVRIMKRQFFGQDYVKNHTCKID